MICAHDVLSDEVQMHLADPHFLANHISGLLSKNIELMETVQQQSIELKTLKDDNSILRQQHEHAVPDFTVYVEQRKIRQEVKLLEQLPLERERLKKLIAGRYHSIFDGDDEAKYKDHQKKAKLRLEELEKLDGTRSVEEQLKELKKRGVEMVEKERLARIGEIAYAAESFLCRLANRDTNGLEFSSGVHAHWMREAVWWYLQRHKADVTFGLSKQTVDTDWPLFFPRNA
jgi:hypothetical protein